MSSTSLIGEDFRTESTKEELTYKIIAALLEYYSWRTDYMDVYFTMENVVLDPNEVQLAFEENPEFFQQFFLDILHQGGTLCYIINLIRPGTIEIYRTLKDVVSDYIA